MSLQLIHSLRKIWADTVACQHNHKEAITSYRKSLSAKNWVTKGQVHVGIVHTVKGTSQDEAKPNSEEIKPKASPIAGYAWLEALASQSGRQAIG